MHLVTDTLVEKMWIDDLDEQHARMFSVGWNTIDVMRAFELPLLSTCRVSPESAENTLSFVPFIEAVQMSVPSGFTVMNATSDS
jgi:hypothetical protein